MRWLEFFAHRRRASGKTRPQSRTRRLFVEPLEDRRLLTAIQLVGPDGLSGAVTAPKSGSWSLVDTAADVDTAEAAVRENWIAPSHVHTVRSRGSIYGLN